MRFKELLTLSIALLSALLLATGEARHAYGQEATAAEAEQSDESKKEIAESWLKFMSQSWQAKATRWRQDDGTSEVQTTGKTELGAGGLAAVRSGSNPEGSPAYVALCRWNSKSQTYSEHGVAANGMTWDCVMDSMSEEKMSGTLTATLPDGTALVGVMSYERKGPKTMQVEHSTKLNGEEVSKVSATVTFGGSSEGGPGALEAIE